MSLQQRQTVTVAAIAAALIAIYVAVQRVPPWSLLVQTIGDARWLELRARGAVRFHAGNPTTLSAGNPTCGG